MEKTKPAVGAMIESVALDGRKDYWIVIGHDKTELEIKLLGDTFRTRINLEGFLNAENWNAV